MSNNMDGIAKGYDTPDLFQCYEKMFRAIKDNVYDKDDMFNLLTDISNGSSIVQTRLKELEYSDYIEKMKSGTSDISSTASVEREFKLNIFSSKTSLQVVPYEEIKVNLLDKYFSDIPDYNSFEFRKKVNVAVIPIPKLEVNVSNTSSAKLFYTFIIIIKSKDSVLWLELPPSVYLTFHSLKRILIDRSSDISSRELFDSLYQTSVLFGNLLNNEKSPYELVFPIKAGLAYGNKDTTMANYAIYNYAKYKDGKITTTSGVLSEKSQPMVVTTYVDRDLMNYKQIALSTKLTTLFNENEDSTFIEKYLALHSNFTTRFNAIRA